MKWIAVFLMCLIVFPSSTFASAGKPRGNKAVVYHEESKFKGTLLYVDEELLVLKEKKSEELLGFSTAKIDKVAIRKSKAGVGILAGLAVGGAITGAILLGIHKKSGESFADVLVIPLLIGVAVATGLIVTVFTAAGGGLLGSLFGWKRFKLLKMDVGEKEIALNKLKGYALFGTFPEELRSRLVTVD